jgi:hypothetical protein
MKSFLPKVVVYTKPVTKKKDSHRRCMAEISICMIALVSLVGICEMVVIKNSQLISTHGYPFVY